MGFEFANVRVSGGEFFAEVLQEFFALLSVGFRLGKLNVGLDVARKRAKLCVGGKLILGALALFEDALCFFLIVPEVGIGAALLEGFQARAVLLRVKDSS